QGWVIESIGRAGERARYRLAGGDPRVRLAFQGDQLREFQRAAVLAGVASARVSQSLVPSGELGWQVGAEESTAYRLSQAAHGHRFRCLLHFGYRDVRRLVSSDAVFHAQGHWYLLGREVSAAASGESDVPLPGAEKHFRISRVRDLSLGPAGSAGPAAAAGDLAVDPLKFVQGPPFDAVVACDEGHRELVQSALGQPSQVQRSGDQLRLTIPVTSRRTFISRVYRLGTRVRVEGPADLRDQLRDELTAHLGGR
ncbi:MAG: hypothetical protein RLZ55_97, partial [Actinomycetota bacterium]